MTFKTVQGQLLPVYKDIHACHVCPKMNRRKELRRVDAVSNQSDVFIVSQALARGTLRESGVNFFNAKGELGKTGQNLERFLNQFGRTVYPQREIILRTGKVASAKEGYIPVYNTELTQSYPGRRRASKKGDRVPSVKEISTCRDQGFLLRELEILKPKIVLLMGRISFREFLRQYLNLTPPKKFSDHMSRILDSGEVGSYVIGGQKIHCAPIYHASPANGKYFSQMLRSTSFVQSIRSILND